MPDGVFFPQPEPVITGPATRVMSLRDGTKKMSKSEPSDMSRINLMDDTDTIADKIKRAKTDMLPAPPANLEELAARPEIDNLVGIYAALAGITKEDALKLLIYDVERGSEHFHRFQAGVDGGRHGKARPDPNGDRAPHGRPGGDRPRACRRGGAGAGGGDADHERGQGYRRLHPLVRLCRTGRQHMPVRR